MPMYMECAKLTDDDLNPNSIPAEGMAQWKIVNVEPGQSRAGAPKTVVTFKVKDSKEKVSMLTEHVPMMVDFRVARLASATGTGEMAKEGRIDVSQWVGKTGSGKIKHEKSDGYPDKAVWAYFSKPKTEPEKVTAEDLENGFNDDIPF